MAQPLFQAPSGKPAAADSGSSPVAVAHVSELLEGLRFSGHDLTSAIAEPIDNAIDATASIVNVRSIRTSDKKSIEAFAFADNGAGMMPDRLVHALQLGYSSRHGERGGLGRFGVGIKLAGLSVARRIEIYSRSVGSSACHMVYVDLDEVKEGRTRFETVEVDGWPRDLADMMRPAATTGSMTRAEARHSDAFTCGTLVVWRKVDRVSGTGPYGTALDEREADLLKYISRAYRKFIGDGLQITLNGKEVGLHDPLFLMENPRIRERYQPAKGRIPRGRIIEQGHLLVDGHAVQVTVCLVPEEFRARRGDGGRHDVDGKDIRSFYINDDASGRISILRNRREISYASVPRMLPNGVSPIDRFVAIEVSFPGQLDEYFQVRSVKRGAEPVAKLRQQLRDWLSRPVATARAEIRATWHESEKREKQGPQSHARAIEATKSLEKSWPAGRAASDVPPVQARAVFDRVIEDAMGENAAQTQTHAVEALHTMLDQGQILILDGAWPGSDLFNLTHLNGKVIVKINRRHPFIRSFYEPMSAIASGRSPMPTGEEAIELARTAEAGFDLLLVSYAKAESLQRDPKKFDDLKSHWAMYLRGLVQGWQETKP